MQIESGFQIIKNTEIEIEKYLIWIATELMLMMIIIYLILRYF